MGRTAPPPQRAGRGRAGSDVITSPAVSPDPRAPGASTDPPRSGPRRAPTGSGTPATCSATTSGAARSGRGSWPTAGSSVPLVSLRTARSASSPSRATRAPDPTPAARPASRPAPRGHPPGDPRVRDRLRGRLLQRPGRQHLPRRRRTHRPRPRVVGPRQRRDVLRRPRGRGLPPAAQRHFVVFDTDVICTKGGPDDGVLRFGHVEIHTEDVTG